MLRTLCLFLLSACLALTAAAGTKRAFIVGVGQYDELPDLQKTTGDADGYAGVFAEDLGFEVTRLIDPDTDRFLEAFNGFLQSIEPGDQVAFVFSGHGWSDGASSFLALRDAPYHTSEFALRKRTISLGEEVLAELRARNPQVVFAIIDACRDNPFDLGTRSITRGIVRVPQVPDVLVVYAAGELEKALDRLGPEDDAPYSVFTREMLPKLADPNFALVSAVDEAREAVIASAATVGHAQNPAVTSNISRKFCFSSPCRLGDIDKETQDWIFISSDGYTPEETCRKYMRHLDRYPDGTYAETARANLRRPECAAARTKFRKAVSAFMLPTHADDIFGLAFSQDGEWIASGSADLTIRVWNARAPDSSTAFSGHTGTIMAVDFSPDGKRLVSASRDGTARIWSVATQQTELTLTGHTAELTYAVFSPDGQRVATASTDGTARVWDAQTGAELLRIDGHRESVRSVRYSPDGSVLLTASNDGHVYTWNAETGERLDMIDSSLLPVGFADFSADGAAVIVAYGNGTAGIFDSAGNVVPLDAHQRLIWNAVLSPDGRLAATSSEEGTILWDSLTGQEVARIRHVTGSGSNWVVFSPDGKRLAIAQARSGSVSLYDLEFEE